MPEAELILFTDHATRCLVELLLCLGTGRWTLLRGERPHLAGLRRRLSSRRAQVSWSEFYGTAVFDRGTVVVMAHPDMLEMRADGVDDVALLLMQRRVDDCLARIGCPGSKATPWLPC